MKLTEKEKELAIYYGEAIDAGDYEQALSHIRKLIELRNNDPVYYLWLGDCYRVSAQWDNALDSYRKALDFEVKYYNIGEEFREDARRYIMGVELIKKATEACQAKKYEEAIYFIDDFTKIDPGWGDIYALRGYCNDSLGNRVLALKDYGLSLTRGLSEQVRPSVEANIKPTESRHQGLIMDEVERDSESSDAIFLQEYVKLLKLIEAYLPILPEIADLPNFDRYSKDIDKLREVLSRNPGKSILIGWDIDGIFVGTKEELASRRRKYPDRQYIYSVRVENMEQPESTIINLNLGSRLAAQDKPKTASKLKELERKRRYYWKNKAKLSAKQNEYDERHRAHIHFKNQYYYMLRNYGISKTYMMKDVQSKSTEDSVYHHMRKDDFF